MSVASFLADPSFPQLGVAGDPELMREVFQGHLRPLGGKLYHIRDCRLSRIRYRKATRCVLQYTLRLVEADTGYERIQWVTGVMYSEDRIRRKWERLRSSDVGNENPGAFLTFEPFSFVPDLSMLVEVFPYDRRLPTLPRLMAGPSPEVEPPLLVRFGPGDWHTEAWNVEPIRYRAELGATLRLRIQARDDSTGRMEERCFYAKVYHDDAGEQTYRVLRTMWDRADESEGFSVGRPVAYLGDLRTLLQEESTGTSLQDILLRDDDTGSAMRRAATAVAALHQSREITPRRHRLRDEIAALERTKRLLQWACPHLEADVEATVAAVVKGLEEGPPAPTHRDLKLDHILLDGDDNPALIDLDGLAGADPILDTANVLAHLCGMPFRFPLPEYRLRTAALTFADEYFGHVPEIWRNRLPVHYAGATLKMAVGFFRRQEPSLPDKIATLIEEARDSLAGRVW